MKKVNAVLCLLLALTVVCVSCKKDDDNENPPTPVEEISESNLRTYVFASCNSDDLATVSNRFTNQVNQLDGDNTDVVIITPNEFSSLTDSQWTEIREVLLNDGAVVFLSPTDQDLKNFSETAVNNWDAFGDGDFSYFDIISRLEYLGDMSTDDSKADNRYRAIGFCSNNILILPNKDMVYTDCTCMSLSEETHEMIDSTCYPSVGETLEYSVKGELDDIVDWANRSVNEAKSQPIDNPTDITNMGTLLEVPLNFILDSDYLAKFYPPGLKEKATRVWKQQVFCRVWSVYDIKNQRDYYLFHQEAQIQGSKLDPVPTNMYQWLQDSNGRWRYYGPFLLNFSCEDKFSNPHCQISDLQPTNSISTTSYTSGHNWSINGGLSISEKPGLNIGGMLTIHESKTTQIPDLGVTVNFEDDYAKFKYDAKILPIGHFWKNWHEIAKDILHSDLDFFQSWIYRIPTKPEDYSKYYLAIDFKVNVTYLYSWNSFLQAESDYKSLGVGLLCHRNLPAPQRAVQEWRMFCNEAPVDSPLQRFLTQCYENYFYNSPFKIGDATRESRKSIDLFIKDFETRLRNDVDLWKNNNFYGTYHFTWQIGNETYKTYTFTVN